MAVSDSLRDILSEHLAPLGAIAFKPMFSGAAVYADGQVFALILRDTVYFKADATTSKDFAAEDCAPFSYDSKTGKRVAMSYWQIPDRLFDEPDEMLAWARRALAVAHGSALGKPRKPRSKPTLKTARKAPRAKR